jgi:hypothetical protein
MNLEYTHMSTEACQVLKDYAVLNFGQWCYDNENQKYFLILILSFEIELQTENFCYGTRHESIYAS